MTITLSPETEAQICEQAAWHDKDAHTLAESYVIAMLEQQKREFEESLAITTRSLQAAEAGRAKPAAQVIAEMREKLRRGL